MTMITENQLVPYTDSKLPVDRGPWIVFAPHADDESFGMGGTLAKAVAHGIKVYLVVMTNGAQGGNIENLVEIRKVEARKASDLLGLQEPIFFDNPDRGLHLQENAMLQVSDIIAQVKPAAVFFPGCFELHPDHRTTTTLVWKVLGSFQELEIVPVSYEILVQSPVNTLVDISRHIEKKREAMNVYASQVFETAYVETSLAMAMARALTLGGKISHAEGFFRFSARDVSSDFESVVMKTLSLFFKY